MIEKIVEGIHKDYDGIVIRGDVPPEYLVPKRPPGYDEGGITIRPGAKPKKPPIPAVGEKRAALIASIERKGGRENDGAWAKCVE